MAQKRKVDSGARAPQQQEEGIEVDDGHLPLWMQEQSWSEWFRRVLASRLFILACFAIDVFLGLDLAGRFGNDAWIALPIIALLIAVEATIYLYLWGSEGRLR
jgi:hypothetical protein